MANLIDRGLPKWPQMYVTGVSVTPEQALEVIRRTDSFFDGYDGNNRLLNKTVKRILNFPDLENFDTLEYHHYLEKKENWEKKWGCIPLYYISNSWISTSFFFGANGWIHPNGKIGFETNIGKYPSVREVLKEWKLVAKEFPFLELGITLMDGECCEDNKPIVSIRVKDGKATLIDPAKEDVHKDQEFESCVDYLETLKFDNYEDFTTGEVISYTRENAIPMEIIKDWSKIIK